MAKVLEAAHEDDEIQDDVAAVGGDEEVVDDDAPEGEEDGAEEVNDDAQESDNAQEDPAAEADAPGAEDAPRKKGASTVIREQKAEVKRLREENERLAREKIAQDAAAAERARLQGGQNAELAAAREREMLANMDPLERLEYQRVKDRQFLENEVRRNRMEAADARDFASFQSRMASDPDLSGYAQEVEQTLANVRASGGDTNREAVLAYLIGRDALANKGQTKKKSQDAAARRVRQVSGNAPSARASGNATKGGGKSLEEKLANIQL